MDEMDRVTSQGSRKRPPSRHLLPEATFGHPALAPRMADSETRLRILLVAPPWFPVPPPRYGGTELVVGSLAHGLVERGHDVTVLTTGDATVAGTRWSAFDTAPTEHIGDASVELAHLLTAYRRRERFDLIHDHSLLGAAMATLAAPSTPVVHTLHGRWTPGATLACRAVQDGCHLVAISHDQARRAPNGITVTRVVHNGIDLSAFPVTTTPAGHLAFLGRANPEKSPHLAVEVARRLGRRLVMGIKVNEPEERAYWRDVVEPAIAGNDVIVVPNASHEEKVAILGGASAVLFPIQWPEPFGLVPVEANACGTPVVAFANGAAVEVVANDRSGVLVDPDAGVDGLVAAVARAERLSRTGCRRHAEEHFSADRMVDDYEELYRSLVTTKAAPRIGSHDTTRQLSSLGQAVAEAGRSGR